MCFFNYRFAYKRQQWLPCVKPIGSAELFRVAVFCLDFLPWIFKVFTWKCFISSIQRLNIFCPKNNFWKRLFELKNSFWSISSPTNIILLNTPKIRQCSDIRIFDLHETNSSVSYYFLGFLTNFSVPQPDVKTVFDRASPKLKKKPVSVTWTNIAFPNIS